MLYADTLRLKEHENLVRQERDCARLLGEHLRHARRCSPPDDAWRYHQLIAKTDALERYFSEMADQVDRMILELGRLSLEIHMLLERS